MHSTQQFCNKYAYCYWSMSHHYCLRSRCKGFRARYHTGSTSAYKPRGLVCAVMGASSDFEVVGGAGCSGSQWHRCNFSYDREAGDPLLLLLFCSKARAPAGREAFSVRQACRASQLKVLERLLLTHTAGQIASRLEPCGPRCPFGLCGMLVPRAGQTASQACLRLPCLSKQSMYICCANAAARSLHLTCLV